MEHPINDKLNYGISRCNLLYDAREFNNHLHLACQYVQGNTSINNIKNYDPNLVLYDVAQNNKSFSGLNEVRIAVIENFDKFDSNLISFVDSLFSDNEFYKVLTYDEINSNGVNLMNYYNAGLLNDWNNVKSDYEVRQILEKELYLTEINNIDDKLVTSDNVVLYIFGSSYTDKNGNPLSKNYDKEINNKWYNVGWFKQLNKYLVTSYGIHDCHKNSGNPQKYENENGHNQDGCILVNNKTKNTWKLIATAFSTQKPFV